MEPFSGKYVCATLWFIYYNYAAPTSHLDLSWTLYLWLRVLSSSRRCVWCVTMMQPSPKDWVLNKRWAPPTHSLCVWFVCRWRWLEAQTSTWPCVGRVTACRTHPLSQLKRSLQCVEVLNWLMEDISSLMNNYTRTNYNYSYKHLILFPLLYI